MSECKSYDTSADHPQILYQLYSTVFFYQILAEFRDVAHAVGKLEQTHVVLEVGMPCRAFFRMDLAEWGPFVKNGGQAEEMFQETDGRMSSNCL